MEQNLALRSLGCISARYPSVSFLWCENQPKRCQTAGRSRAPIRSYPLRTSEEPQAANPCSGLTERALAVLKLIANGCTDQKIADQLMLTVSTVNGPVSHIPSKLHLADPTPAAVFAEREGAVRRRNK